MPSESWLESQLTTENSEILSRQGGATVLLESECVYKFGTRIKRNEADALVLVAERTRVPVPKVLQFEQFGDVGFMTMSLVAGHVLSDAWTDMPSQTRDSIMTQLKGYVSEWRRVTQPASCNGAFVCGVTGGPVSSYVPIPGPPFTGPFSDDFTFRKTIGEAYYASAGRRRTPTEVTDSLPPSSSVLTHCDLVPRNILVDGDRITGIIDWEFSGWYPEYWEYAFVRHKEWGSAVSSFLDPHPEALSAVNFVRHVLF